jgi:hypothetical protein
MYLSKPGATLARMPRGRYYGVFPNGDRRRRAVARLNEAGAKTLESEGAITRIGDDVFKASEAGVARARRDGAHPSEAFLTQHVVLEDRVVGYAARSTRTTRSVTRSPVLKRLANLCDAHGAPWLSADELRAAQVVRHYWEQSQIGLVRRSDLTAPPVASGARGAGNAVERAAAARIDAGRKVTDALGTLATPVRRIVERVCFLEEGFETMERREKWPPRSAKLALKLGLAQLAAAFGAVKP